MIYLPRGTLQHKRILPRQKVPRADNIFRFPGSWDFCLNALFHNSSMGFIYGKRPSPAGGNTSPLQSQIPSGAAEYGEVITHLVIAVQLCI